MIDRATSVRLAECSTIAYQDKEQADDNLRAMGFMKVSWFDARGTEAFIASNAQQRVIAFRGTEPAHLEDWQADIRCNRVNHEYGSVHKGFAIAYLAVAKDVRKKLAYHNWPDYSTTHITGHSLGAALATLCAAEMVSRYHSIRLCTFGSPRVGNRKFARILNRMCWTERYVNNNDIVTRCPSPIRFWHVGHPLYISSKGRVIVNPSQAYRFYDRLRGYLVDVGTPGMDGVKDHSMMRYCQNLSREYGYATTLDLSGV